MPATPPSAGPETQVVVVGAGPVGLMLAGELRLRGVDVVVLERRTSPTTESRASTLHARTMELLDDRGLLDVIGPAPHEPRGHFGGIPLDLTLPSRFAGQWKVPQVRTEEVLQEWATSLGAVVRRGWDVVAVTPVAGGVVVLGRTATGLRRVRGSFVVACDGEDSTVRGLVGAEFPGQGARRELLRADVLGLDLRDRRFERLPRGLAVAARSPAGVTRVMVHELGRAPRARDGAPDFAEVADTWERVTGEDIRSGRPVWVNAFGDASRLLARYRSGRVLFAGDAAHQQMPIGGQALNLGLQDAVNLGWKLALHLGPCAPEGLLDTYGTERRHVAERVLANIRAQALLLLGPAEVEPVRGLVRELAGSEAARARLAGMVSGLDVRYDVGPGEHALLGRRLPEVAVRVGAGPTTSTALLRSGRGLLLERAGRSAHVPGTAAPLWGDRVTAGTLDPGVLAPAEPAGDPGAGHHRAGSPDLARDEVDRVLVRPDGYVAWAGSDPAETTSALRRWFGAPLAA